MQIWDNEVQKDKAFSHVLAVEVGISDAMRTKRHFVNLSLFYTFSSKVKFTRTLIICLKNTIFLYLPLLIMKNKHNKINNNN